MHVVSTAVLLTAVVMAQADEMSDVLKLPPRKDHMYLVDVTTEASVDDLKASLVNLTIEDCYKVIGEQQYLIVFNSNDTAAFRSLKFPAGSEVTQMAVEHRNKYMELFEAGNGMEDKYIPLRNPDSVLLYFDMRKGLPQTLCSKTYRVMMKALAEEYIGPVDSINSRAYSVIANYPPRFLAIEEMEENAFQNSMRKGLEIIGGQGLHDSTAKRVVRVSL